MFFTFKYLSLEPPSAASKRAAENTARSLKNWEEEEKKGAAGTNAQLLYANSELSHLRLQYKGMLLQL